jgi:hypothetical protein
MQINGYQNPNRDFIEIMVDKNRKKLKFYGLNDYGTFFWLQDVMDYLSAYDEGKTDYTLSEILELYNVLQFIRHDVFPNGYDDKQRATYKALMPKLKKSVALFFKVIDESNAQSVITEISYDFRQDLLLLLVSNKVHERVSAATLLAALKGVGVDISDILKNKAIVIAYDADIRLLILSEPKNAEQLICKHLEARDRCGVYLPPSLTPNDSHALIASYIDSKEANPNYIKLIADSRVNKITGIDAKIKLKAKRKHDAWNEEFFKSSPCGMTVGCGVYLADEQEEPLKLIQDSTTTIYSYGRKWFEEHITPVEIVDIFICLFGFVHEGMILSLPAYRAELGVFDRFMIVKGKESYLTGVAFQFRNQIALLQTMMYEKFLRNREQQLEDVIAWFFNDYLKERFAAEGFKYTPSSKTSTYLEKSRHVFTEMESIIKQFSLYVENDEIDKDLLSITSNQVRYHEIPSQVVDKYAYITNHDDIALVLHYLFSDQSDLTYINDTLQSDSLFKLLSSEKVAYDVFQDYQKPQIDRLIDLAVLEKVGAFIKFRSEDQIVVLNALFDVEALSYHYHSAGMRAEIDNMVNKGWLVRKSTLLTDSEASYFNYFLNQQEFSDGYDLRNKYLHGSQADKDDENAHYKTYVITLELMVSLMIKMRSDFLVKNLLTKK